MFILDIIYGYLQTICTKRHSRLLSLRWMSTDFPAWSKQLDLFFNFSRPALEQHLSSHLLVRRRLMEAGRLVGFGLLGIGSNVLFYKAVVLSRLSLAVPIQFFFFVLPWLLLLFDLHSILNPYFTWNIRETYGKARWMKAIRLQRMGMLVFRGHIPEGKAYFAPFNAIYDIVLDLKLLFTSRLFVGKPGSGKSSTFHARHLRDFARFGNAIVVDVKGELYALTANYFQDKYRLDFKSPNHSDRFNLLAACRGDDTLTAQVANYIMTGGSKDGGRGGDNNKFFYDGAAALLTSVILHLGEDPDFPNPTISDVYSLLAGGQDPDPEADSEEHLRLLNAKLRASPSVRARQTWSAFTSNNSDPRTIGNILATLYTAIEGFRESKINKVFQSPTKEEAALGCREIDWNFLRGKTRTCLYLVMTAEQANRLGAIVSTIFGIAMSRLLAEVNDPSVNALTPCYLQIDEGGNFRISGISEFVAQCRGSSVCVDLSVQSIEQLSVVYGENYAKQIVEVFGTKVILPGAEGKTAQYVSDMIGHATTRERKVVDLPGTDFDRTEDREVSRHLIAPDELRTMGFMQEAIAIIGTYDPIRICFPAFASALDPIKAVPVLFSTDETPANSTQGIPRPLVVPGGYTPPWESPVPTRRNLPQEVIERPDQITATSPVPDASPRSETISAHCYQPPARPVAASARASNGSKVESVGVPAVAVSSDVHVFDQANSMFGEEPDFLRDIGCDDTDYVQTPEDDEVLRQLATQTAIGSTPPAPLPISRTATGGKNYRSQILAAPPTFVQSNPEDDVLDAPPPSSINEF